MTPDIETMREYVRKMYVGDRWRRRVRKMTDSQVVAIYTKQQAKVVQAENRKRQNPDIPF